jgi:transposase
MTAWRRAFDLTIENEVLAKLTAISRSRTEPASRVERARMLLAYREDPSFFAVGQALDVHHQTVQRCIERAVVFGPLAALDDRQRPGKEPTITAEAKAWLVSLACRKAKELGYPHESAARAKTKPSDAVAIVSYDEKPGIQAIATTAPDLPPEPGVHATFGRDHEYKRHGTVSLLAGIDLLTGKVHALVKDRHRSREFIEFLKLLDRAYPTHTAIKLVLDNHSAHISKESKAWLAEQPAGRFEFTFTPKHGSWLNLVEGFFSKLARSVLRHIRVASKQELKERIMAAMDDINQNPVVHTWAYKLDKAA